MSVIVAEVEGCHFRTADAGGVEELEDDAVPQSEGAGKVRSGHESLDFLWSKSLGELAGLLSGEVEIAGRVGWNGAVAAESGKEPSDASEPCELSIDGKGAFGAW